MCNRPQPSDPSYDLFQSEFSELYESLKRRAAILSKFLNEIDGITCQNISGAMYAFPRIQIPQKAIEV